MKVVIESVYYVRGNPITAYISFPRFSTKIEETLINHLTFLKKCGKFSLTMKVIGE